MNLNTSQVQTDSIQIIGKGNKERRIFHTPATKKALAAWMEVRGTMNPQTDALFITKNGTRVTTRGVQDIVNKYLKKAGLFNFTHHIFRTFLVAFDYKPC